MPSISDRKMYIDHLHSGKFLQYRPWGYTFKPFVVLDDNHSNTTKLIYSQVKLDNPTPTLARGQAKALYKQVDRMLVQGISKLERSVVNINKFKMYKGVTKAIDYYMQDLIIDKKIIGKKGKRSQCIYLIMSPGDIPGRVSLDLVNVTARPLDVRVMPYPACITRDCIERMFQRRRIVDANAAVRA